jgi:hippurate hydrolase
MKPLARSSQSPGAPGELAPAELSLGDLGLDERSPLVAELRAFRRTLHAHPETAFEEHRTAELVAERLVRAGLEVHRGVGRTGVVGVLRVGSGSSSIGLRADLDALPIQETSDVPHRSQVAGKMHACGHDGHTAMLLGAACQLAATRRFDGTAVFVFQPAEEHEGGARAMLADRLFERFPMQAIFGLHNWPSLPAGEFAVMPGPMMACSDRFWMNVRGRGGHGAMPHDTRDPVVAGAALVQAVQTLVSRSVRPVDPAVLSITQFHAGDTWNVIPDTAVLRGTARAFSEDVRALLESGLARVVDGVARAHDVSIEFEYERGYPPTVNTPEEARFAAEVMRELLGAERVHTTLPPSMAAEDFSDFLAVCPGAYVWLGSGRVASAGSAARTRSATEGTSGGPLLHSSAFDFNDDVLPLGVAFWVRLVERWLSPR